MHRKSTIITSLLLGLVLAVVAAAHGGFDHVIGTVVKLDNNMVTVKTVHGNVDVKLDDQTEITRGDHKGEAADLKPGTRVVIDIPEGSKDKIAHSVKVGVSGVTTH
jgi:RNase P/RNase MRP subunit p29